MLFLPTFPSIKRQRIGSISFSNTHHIRLLLPNLTIWWGNTKMVYVPTTYQISPSSSHFYASSLNIWGFLRVTIRWRLRNSHFWFIRTTGRECLMLWLYSCMVICTNAQWNTVYGGETASGSGLRRNLPMWDNWRICRSVSSVFAWVRRNTRIRRINWTRLCRKRNVAMSWRAYFLLIWATRYVRH